MSESSRESRAYWALTAALFVDFLGYAYIVPILPAWQHRFELTATQATMLVSLWAVPMFLLGPWTGKLTDKLGAGRTILISLVLLTASSLLYLVATKGYVGDPFTILVIARLVHGASGAAVMTAALASASKLWPNRFGEQAGKLLASAAIGGLVGPVMGGVLFQFHPSVAFITLAVLTALTIPIMFLASKDIGVESGNAQGNVSIKVFITNPVLLRVGILLAITTLATGALEAGAPLFLHDSLGLSTAAIGGVLLVMVLTQGLGSMFWGRLVDKRGPTRYMTIGWLVVSVSLISVGVAGKMLDGMMAILAMLVLLGIYQFAIAAAQIPMLPMIDTAATQAYGDGNPGLAFGAFGTAWAAGTIVGPMIVGPFYDLFNSWPIALGMLGLPAIVGLVITVRNKQMLADCYASEMEKRLAEDGQ